MSRPSQLLRINKKGAPGSLRQITSNSPSRTSNHRHAYTRIGHLPLTQGFSRFVGAAFLYRGHRSGPEVEPTVLAPVRRPRASPRHDEVFSAPRTPETHQRDPGNRRAGPADEEPDDEEKTEDGAHDSMKSFAERDERQPKEPEEGKEAQKGEPISATQPHVSPRRFDPRLGVEVAHRIDRTRDRRSYATTVSVWGRL